MRVANLKKQLLSARKKSGQEENILSEVRRILEGNEAHRSGIAERLQSEGECPAFLKFDHLDREAIFHISQIRKVCIDYRLRFLDSRHFKDGIPEEAISKVRALEDMHETTIKGFKIMAPSKAFRLKNYDDPLLFAPLGDEHYYLVHKWGKDLRAWRKLAFLPVRSLGNFIVLCLIVSIFITWITPESLLSRDVPLASIIIFLFAFKSVVAIFLYSYFFLGKRFNDSIWNSEYFNH